MRMGFDAVDMVAMLPARGTRVFTNESKTKLLDHGETCMIHWVHYPDDTLRTQ